MQCAEVFAFLCHQQKFFLKKIKSKNINILGEGAEEKLQNKNLKHTHIFYAVPRIFLLLVSSRKINAQKQHT